MWLAHRPYTDMQWGDERREMGGGGSCATAERRELKSECALGRIVSFQGQVTYIEFYEFRLSIQNKPNMNRLHCFFCTEHTV